MARVYLAVTTLFLGSFLGIGATPLDDYVNAFDPHYSYRFLNSTEFPNFSLHTLNMTSQKWLTENTTTRPIWWHYVTVVVPKDLVYTDTALVWIDEGSNDDRPPTETDLFLAVTTALGVSTGAIAAIIKQIPNQPMAFSNDPTHTQKYGDRMEAWTMNMFLQNSSNPEILLRFPCTKAVVRGFDTIVSYAKKTAGVDIQKFLVSGASKGGWTVWTTAAVDKRVIGMAPVVNDMLNVHKNLHHHFRSLGGWSFALGDFQSVNITGQLDSPNMQKLLSVTDPFAYKDRLTMPKLIVCASGDEFFLLDDSHYYLDQLPGLTYLRMIPNANHADIGHVMSTVLTIKGFILNILEKAPFPKVKWSLSQNETAGKIVMWTSEEPQEVTVYHARTLSGNRRDFRMFILNTVTGKRVLNPVLWHSRAANRLSPTQYDTELLKPSEGWAAFFIQVKMKGVKGSFLEFTTEVNIVPDVLPFADCSGDACYGTLV
ncbi:unnamed protein product [Lymnaea stagnalis]|uniref:Autocrine proliferation repressor A-like n=1 Tax=Lymnaea stagnalis TaxID=6523 RepID=A0AAV2I875_LYMST